MASVSIIGSGKAATFFCKWLYQSGHNVDRLIARNESVGQDLALRYHARFDILTDHIEIRSDFIILAVSDLAISDLSAKIKTEGIVLHLSGASKIEVLKREINCGVIWPLISMNQEGTPDRSIPLLIEGIDSLSSEKIRLFAASLSDSVHTGDFKQRQSMHIAAVFASNFANYLYHIAWKICKENNMDFTLLLPLIRDHIVKLGGSDPFLRQTGPAVRGDKNITEKQEQLLKENGFTNEALLYRMFTNLLLEQAIQAGEKN